MTLEVQSSRKIPGVYISTYGCQMNVNDTERMFSILEMAGFAPVATPDIAELIIINSCSVREKPVHKVHSEVGRYRVLKSRNPSLRIGVGGCVGQQEKDKLLKDLPILDFVFGPDNIDDLPNLVEKAQITRHQAARFEYSKPYEIQTLIRNPKVSTFVNVTKGCDNFCSFCVVPFTRGRERSRKLSEVIRDIKTLIERGVKEVTFLGQNVNSYTSECGADFADLIKEVMDKTSLERIRFTTNHPKDFNEKLVKVMAQDRKRVCEYIHLPIQSGNSEVLARMNRGYTRPEYLEKIQMIQSYLPDVSLSTDIICGFPGETDSQFEDTLSLLNEVPYEAIYAFKYSPRPFTKAARLDGQIEETVKDSRLERVLDLHRQIAQKLMQRYVNRELEILVEDFSSGIISGRSTHNKIVRTQGSSDSIGKLIPVYIQAAHLGSLKGGIAC